MTQLYTQKMLPSTIGFDKIFSIIDEIERKRTQRPSFPFYDIIKLNENAYKIDIALAGYMKENIDIETKNKMLTISGKYFDESGINYLYKGISKKEFSLSFTLNDTTIVKQALFTNGILEILLENIVPEEKLVKKIRIL